jgi:hypothetical protein
MSNSATARTSTTASSTNSASKARRCTGFGSYETGRVGRDRDPNSVHLVSGEDRDRGKAPDHIEIVACGALAGHIREIAARRSWPVIVRPISAALHNRPQRILGDAKRAIDAAQTNGARAVLAYADCGTYGALDKVATQTGAQRLPGLHCYDLYAGHERVERIFAEEPGTYLLTDYLIKSFERAVIKPLGLDSHPELWPDYFGHYKRLVWLAQKATSELEEAATRIASQFNLPLTRIDTGTTGLEAALAALIEPPL